MESTSPQSTQVSDEEMNHIKVKLTSVFRKYSNMVHEESNNEKVVKAATKLFEMAWKGGSEFLSTKDPFEAALSIFGKTVVGSSLSKISTNQVAGLLGVIISSVQPQVANIFSSFQIKFDSLSRQQFPCFSRKLQMILII